MHPPLTADIIGDGVARTRPTAGKTEPVAGSVVGTFRSGYYVRAAGTIFAVCGPEIPAGPIHLILETAPPLPPVQSLVHLEPARLRSETGSIDLSSARRYRPNQPTREQLRMIAPVLARLYAPDAIPQDIAHVRPALEDAVMRSDLNQARKLIEGLGGGLTPTGDDVLAGLLLFAKWSDTRSARPSDIARRAATSDLSRCFLEWAAVGQSIKPVHDLVDAAGQIASGTDRASAITAQVRFGRAVNLIASIGRSSGKGILAGLGLAAAAHRP